MQLLLASCIHGVCVCDWVNKRGNKFDVSKMLAAKRRSVEGIVKFTDTHTQRNKMGDKYTISSLYTACAVGGSRTYTTILC